MKFLNDVGLSYLIDKIKFMISKKADKSEIPTKVGQLENDKNYVTDAELGNAGYGDMTKSVYDKNKNGIVDRAEVADSVDWGKVKDKPATFPPSGHTHPSIIVADTRNVNELPSEVPSRTFAAAFKTNTVINNPPVTTGSSYSHIVTMNGWTGAGAGGGGQTTQLAFGDSLAVRVSQGPNTWGPWKRLALEDDIPTKFTWGDLKGV